MNAIILTRSGKYGGACVAGIDLETNTFVRFVGEAYTAKEIPFSDIRGINELDIVEVKTIRRCPIGPQTENILVPRAAFCKKDKYSGTIEDLQASILYPDDPSLLETTDNRLKTVDCFQHSLEMVLVRNLLLKKYIKPYDNCLTTRASFSIGSLYYDDFRVTDFKYDLRESEDESIMIPYAAVVLSIPKNGFSVNGIDMGYYKFIASIFPIYQ